MRKKGRILLKIAPFIRLLLPLIAGILLQKYLSLSLIYIGFCLVSLTISLIAYRLLPVALHYKLKAIQGFVISGIVLISGMLLSYRADIRNHQDWFRNVYHDSDYIGIRILEPLDGKGKTYKTEGEAEHIITGSGTKNCRGKILLYFQEDSSASHLQYGDRILINKPPQLITNKGNPGEFNYQQYTANKQLYYSIYLGKNDWIKLNGNKSYSFWKLIFTTRQAILNILERYIPGKEERSIAEALLIGYRGNLDNDTLQSFSNTGVIHVIVIAGLHLGIIYMLLSWLLNKIKLTRQGPVRMIILLVILWMFALLTGANPSVMRAVVMLSFIIAGEGFQKRHSIYNTIAASSFLLLCFNPFLLWDTGFQLSYLAVLSIVTFQRPIYAMWAINNTYLDKVWRLISVSLSAQVLTFPACLFYFHQFPLLFIIANLIAVPLTILILYSEIILIIISLLPPLAFYWGRFTGYLIGLMNKAILYTSHLPGAVWNAIPATLISTIVLYLATLMITYWLYNKSRYAFLFFLACIASLFVWVDFYKWETASQQKIIVYNIPRSRAIDLVSGHQYLFIADSSVSNPDVFDRYIKPSRTQFALSRMSDKSLENSNSLILNNKKICFIDSSFKSGNITSQITPDITIISKGANVHIDELHRKLNSKLYIFDASNSLWKIQKWKKECESLHLSFYSVPEQGAYVADL